MEKNGLLLCSIGFLIFMFSGGSELHLSNIFSMITGIFFIVTGVVLIRKNNKKNKKVGKQ